MSEIRNGSTAISDLTLVQGPDDDAPVSPRPPTILQVVTPGCPASFLGDGCLLVVARDGLFFDIALRGSLVVRNQHAIGRVLAVVVAHAVVMRLSLAGLEELDDAGATMLDDAAKNASRRNVEWEVVDGDLMWQLARGRAASGTSNDSPSVRRPPMRRVAASMRRTRPPVLPIT